jgi:KipI family sensor histidine kinase inhibitor
MGNFGTPNFHMLGPHALVLEVPGDDSLEAQRCIWRLHACARRWTGVIESVPATNNLTLLFDPALLAEHELRNLLLDRFHEAAPRDENPCTHTIPVRYGGEHGPDIDAVAAATGLSAEDVAALHCAREYRVYFVGFQPGFAYLGDLDERLRLPRRTEPRARVPARAVAIAGSQTAIYPFASPGGWHLIGSAEIEPFDARREPAALFAPGDIFRFRAVQ